MPSFYIPLSGLNADSTALNTIANNLSNMNTTGFKAQKTNFSDLFYQQVGTTGSGDEIQVGTGVQVASNSTDYTGGSVASTGVATDAAINGTGFFVLDAGNGSQLYTRDGNFQVSSTGTLESTEGQAVMGYLATNGVINISNGLADLSVPSGQVMQPSATTSMSMTQNLDSTSAIGSQASGQVQVFDSLGKNYEATVTYTNLGGNKWSYAITLPDTLTAAAATAATATTMAVTAATPVTTSVTAATTAAKPSTTVANQVSSSTLAAISTGPTLLPAINPSASVSNSTLTATTGAGSIAYTLTPTGMISSATVLKITDGVNTATITPVTDMTPANFATLVNTQLGAAVPGAITATATGVDGVPGTNTNGTLSIVGAGISITVTPAGVQQDVAETMTSFNLAKSNGAVATVAPATSLNVQLGNGAVISAPTFTTNQPVATYAAALQAAVGVPAVSGVTITGSNTTGILSITGPSNMVIGGNLVQNFTGTQYNYALGSYTDPTTGLTTPAGIDKTTSLTISALDTSGNLQTVPIILSNPAGESLATYVTDIQNQLAALNVTGVTVTGTNGILSITGPSGNSGMTVAGYVNQDILGTIVPSSVTPTSAVTTASTITLPQAALTPPSSSTTTLSPLASTAPTGNILPAALVTVPSVTNSTLTATTGAGSIAYTLTPTGMISSATVLEITDGVNTATITPVADMTPANFATLVNTQLAAAVPGAITATATGVDGVPGTNTNGTLSIAGAGILITATPAGVQQDVDETTTNYNLVTSNSAQAMIGPSTGAVPATNLAITVGAGAPVSAPAFTTSMTLANYAAALQTAVGVPTVSGVTVTPNAVTGQLSITGPANMAITGNLVQDFSATNLVYNFGVTGTVGTGTSLKITGPTTAGATNPNGIGTTALPTITAGETVTQYATDLNTAIGNAHLAGVTASANAVTGQLTIVGPSSITTSGAIAQDLDLTTRNYNFVTSNGTLATVSPSTTLAITEGGTTVTVPAFSSTQSVATYAANLQAALTSNLITDVTVTGTGGVLSITGPANMTIAGKVNQTFTGSQSSLDFGSYTDPNTGLTALATVDPTTSLTITGPTTAGGSTTVTVTPTNPAGESVALYMVDVQNALAAAKITGISLSVTNGVLTIIGPDTATIAGTVGQNMLGTTTNYAFQTNSTVDPTTNLKITGLTSTGSTATITAPAITSGETVAQYAAALTSAISTAGITNAVVTSANGQLSIVGANLSTSGSLNQGLADTTISYDFGSSATVNSATALTIVGPTVSGTPATAITVAPAVTAGETVTQYAADLTKALAAAGIDTSSNGVSIKVNGGQLSIIGPAATLKTAGIASEDLTATTISYNFGISGSTIAAVDPKTNLTITGMTASGATATTTVPTVTLGESLAQYVNDLTTALTTAGIAGVMVSSTAGGQLTITGANLSTAGSVIQDPVGSANSSGTLTFDSSGNLVNPTANLSNITFAGLSDSAAIMNLNWGLFGASGKGVISQTASASGQSNQTQNGYTSGQYHSFTIGSDGTITAAYSNGQNQTVGQIGLASVSNLQGLADVGSTEYQTTTASGIATVGVAGTGGLGTLQGASLEASNVNISAEFSDLIIAQRAFEANSKAVTTFDTITQETINMIH